MNDRTRMNHRTHMRDARIRRINELLTEFGAAPISADQIAVPQSDRKWFRPCDLETRWGIGAAARLRWERRVQIPLRDVIERGKPVGWRRRTIVKFERDGKIPKF